MSDYDDGNDQSSRAGRAAQNISKKAAKKGGKHAARWILYLLGAKGIIAVSAFLLIMLVIAAAIGATNQAAAAAAAAVPTACGATPAAPTSGAAPVPVTGTAGNIAADQNTNAQAIIAVAVGLNLGYQGALIGVLTANVESDLHNVAIGDMVGPGGSMSSSRGLFQQIAAWGALADRMDPTKSATMFFQGGPAGQKGLTQVAGWQSMDPAVAMQAVQQSEFSQLPGNQSPGLAEKLALATSVTQSIMGAGATSAPPAAAPAVPVAAPVPCPAAAPAAAAGGVAVALNGPVVTIPDNPDVVQELRGYQLTTPNAGVAKGIAAGFGLLGTPYVWGGSGADGSGPDNGCARGGGQLNSCGSTIGIDCSGLTAYVIVAGGFPGPGTNSGAQRSSGTDIPWANGAPGDIVGFEGHVAIYLGNISGTDYILEASDIGIPLHVVKLTRTDHDPVLHRHWS